MTISPPDLVQRGEIKKLVLPEVSSFGKEVQLDFMGPHEYGVNTGISLRSIQNSFNKYHTTELLIPLDGQKLQLFHRFDEDEFSAYVVWLFDMRIGRLQTRVRSNFAICKPEDNRGTDFWWDLINHCMWSFNKDFMTKLPSYLTGEFEKLDQARIRRQLGGLA